MATHSSVLAWRIPGIGEPGGLPSMGSHRAAAAWCYLWACPIWPLLCWGNFPVFFIECFYYDRVLNFVIWFFCISWDGLSQTHFCEIFCSFPKCFARFLSSCASHLPLSLPSESSLLGGDGRHHVSSCLEWELKIISHLAETGRAPFFLSNQIKHFLAAINQWVTYHLTPPLGLTFNPIKSEAT